MRLRSLVLVISLLLVAPSCSDGGSDSATTTAPTATPTTKASGTTEPAGSVPALKILVTNDDGYEAAGIDALVEGLSTIDNVEIIVYAPREQQSGQGGKSTDGPLAVTDVALLSGHPARAVDGFPADSVRVAMDEDGVEPDLVVSGINEGQNLGPLVDLSGTVGASRAAVRRGVPALAVSQGTPEKGGSYDYAAAVPLVLDWVRDHQSELLKGTQAKEVTNLNVPSCSLGAVRGLAEIPSESSGDLGEALLDQDCTGTTNIDVLKTEIPIFRAGFATINIVPTEPVLPSEVVPAA